MHCAYMSSRLSSHIDVFFACSGAWELIDEYWKERGKKNPHAHLKPEPEEDEDEEMREARLRDEVYEELASLNSVAVDDG